MKNKYFDIMLLRVFKLKTIIFVFIETLMYFMLPIIIFVLFAPQYWYFASASCAAISLIRSITSVIFKQEFNFDNNNIEVVCKFRKKKIDYADIKKVYFLNDVFLISSIATLNTFPRMLKIHSKKAFLTRGIVICFDPSLTINDVKLDIMNRKTDLYCRKEYVTLPNFIELHNLILKNCKNVIIEKPFENIKDYEKIKSLKIKNIEPVMHNGEVFIKVKDEVYNSIRSEYAKKNEKKNKNI